MMRRDTSALSRQGPASADWGREKLLCTAIGKPTTSYVAETGGAEMLARVFKHGIPQQLETVRPAWTRSITRFTSSAHAFESPKNDTHIRRSRDLEARYDGVVCSSNDKIDGAMSMCDWPLGRSSNRDLNMSSRS